MTMNRMAFIVIAVIAITSAFFAGKAIGTAEQRATNAEQKNEAITASINTAVSDLVTDTKKLTERAEKASIALSNAVSERIQADEKTTRDIKNALKTTETQRVNCVFDDSVMLELDAARARANQATSRGLKNSSEPGNPSISESSVPTAPRAKW